MKYTIIENKRFGEKYYKFRHKSGLKIRKIKVPDGTAHYLEHKLFESEEGDAFKLYAKTGASANAYTSFDTTCYLFSCTDNFKESLGILFDLIQSPYFTPETIEKEQGIIGQEIKMYQDSPEWMVNMNLLQALYHNHPINIDIAGTVDTIAEITPESVGSRYLVFRPVTRPSSLIPFWLPMKKSLPTFIYLQSSVANSVELIL